MPRFSQLGWIYFLESQKPSSLPLPLSFPFFPLTLPSLPFFIYLLPFPFLLLCSLSFPSFPFSLFPFLSFFSISFPSLPFPFLLAYSPPSPSLSPSLSFFSIPLFPLPLFSLFPFPFLSFPSSPLFLLYSLPFSSFPFPFASPLFPSFSPDFQAALKQKLTLCGVSQLVTTKLLSGSLKKGQGKIILTTALLAARRR